MSGRGGARHRPKPYIETGLLHKVLSKHEDPWVDMKGYELLSRNSAADPRALYNLLPLVGDLLDLEPSCEIHPQPLRACLTKMITEKPELNNSKFKGSVYVNLRAERIGVLLSHVRRLSRGGGVQACVSNLTGLEYSLLQDTLKKVVTLPTEALSTSLKKEKPSKGPLKKDCGGSPLKKGEGALVLLKKETMPKKRKRAPSEVSVDSKGWPMELATPKKMAASPPKLWKRGRVGHQSAKAEVASETGHSELQEAMCLRQKPAAALKKAPCASPSTLKKVKTLKKDSALKHGRKPWAKITKTTASKPERCYLIGAHEPGEKLRLIVEVSKKRSLQYIYIIDMIKEALHKKHLTKEEALDMSDDLCCQFP